MFIKTRNRSFHWKRTASSISRAGEEESGDTHHGETIEAYASMNEMEGTAWRRVLPLPQGYLVNMAYVAEYDSGSITLNNGEYVYLAKEKYGEFVKAYMRYLRNGVGADG